MKNKRRSPTPAKRRPLEFYVISAQELKNVKKFRKMKAFAVAYVDPTEKVSTRIDEEGGTDPTWDEKLTLTVDEDLLSDESAQLAIEICASGTLRNKLVGSVRVMLADALKVAGNGANRFPVVSYLVFNPSGDPQGILNICIPPNGIFPGGHDSLSFKSTPSINAHSLSFGNQSSAELEPAPREEDNRDSLSIDSFTSDEDEEDSVTEVQSKPVESSISEIKPLALTEGKPAKSVRTK